MFDVAMFKDLVGSQVPANSEAHGSVMLQITEVEKAAGDRPDNAFSVLFKGPAEPFLDQMTHEITLGEHGVHPLFLVPINDAPDGYIYEAVFTSFDD